jgi:hypothetical protein
MCYVCKLSLETRGPVPDPVGLIEDAFDGNVEVTGEYPSYELSRGGSACGFVNGGQFSCVSEIERLAHNSLVKKVTIRWAWNNQPPGVPKFVRCSAAKFRRLSEEGSLKDGNRYQITA